MAEVSPSVVQGWRQGAYPSENIAGVKKLCNRFGVSLSFALTGESDLIDNPDPMRSYHEEEWFDGYAHIKIVKLIPRKK